MSSGFRGVRWRVAVRLLHLVFAVCLFAAAIELIDQGGLAGENSGVASVAATMRNVRSGDISLQPLSNDERFTEFVERVSGSFDEVVRTLEQ